MTKVNNVQELIAALSGANPLMTVNITVNNVEAAPVVEELPETDFELGDRVLICHTRKDGTGTKHTMAEVIEVLGQDDDGYYTRFKGDNGNHYKTGILFDQERKGTKAIDVDAI